MKIVFGAPLLFIGLLGSGFYIAECFFGDSNCFLELLGITVPVAWIGHRMLRSYAAVEDEASYDRHQDERQIGGSGRKESVNSTSRARKRLVWGCYVVIVGSVTSFIALAVANPDSLRVTIQVNEEAAMRDVRAVLSAETAYARSNGGHYDTIDCLVRPAECIPSYSADGSAFLSESLDGVRRGFIREFIPGPPADAEARSTSSIETFVFVAYPERPGETGVRSYCGDSSGAIFVKTDGSRPVTDDGQCEPGLASLE